MDAELKVDGNAAAGLLREVFVHEMTSARIACDGCGQVEPMGAAHAYMHAPGLVLRCHHCEAVLLVLTQRRGGYLLGFQRSKWLEVASA